MFKQSVLHTSDGSHATTARSGKAMPQFEETPGADKAHRYGSDWLVSGKRQYDHQVKAEKFRTHDPLKTMSAFDTQPWHHGQPEPWVMGGSLRQTRFHCGFQRRRADAIDPFKQRIEHSEAMAERSRQHAPPRREYIASQIWRNGKDPIANANPASSCIVGPHLEKKHGDPFDPMTGYRTFVAQGGHGGRFDQMPPLGAFPSHQQSFGRYDRNENPSRRLACLTNEGLGAPAGGHGIATRKDCSAADAFTTYEVPFTAPLIVHSVRDHVTKPH